MDSVPCRDCGYLLEPDWRGCPKCALNLEAEQMIDHFVWRRLAPSLVVLGLIVAGVIVYLIR